MAEGPRQLVVQLIGPGDISSRRDASDGNVGGKGAE